MAAAIAVVPATAQVGRSGHAGDLAASLFAAGDGGRRRASAPGEQPDVQRSWPGPGAAPDLAPLSFLLGRWEGAGVGGYPNLLTRKVSGSARRSRSAITDAYSSIYASRELAAGRGRGTLVRPLATQNGYGPSAGRSSQQSWPTPTGIAEIYLGEVTRTEDRAGTDVVARTPRRPRKSRLATVAWSARNLDLGWRTDMAMGQPLQPHLPDSRRPGRWPPDAGSAGPEPVGTETPAPDSEARASSSWLECTHPYDPNRRSRYWNTYQIVGVGDSSHELEAQPTSLSQGQAFSTYWFRAS